MESMFWADIVNQAILRILLPFRVVKHLFSHISGWKCTEWNVSVTISSYPLYF